MRLLKLYASGITLLIKQWCILSFAYVAYADFTHGQVQEVLGTTVPILSSNATFDYIVVGGGNAGLTIASRLTENPTVRVAVIEAGDSYQKECEWPANDARYNGKDPADTGPDDWGFTTTPQAALEDQVVHYARGKALGGSTALNFMAYAHAPNGAMQKWADDVGDPAYEFDNVSKYYYKSLNFTPPDQGKRSANSTPDYDTSTLGSGGPLDITYPNHAQAFGSWISKALETLGILPSNGFTGGKLSGSGWIMDTINQTTGTRESSETAFLRPVLDRNNLVVYTNTLAERIIFENSMATGVHVSSQHDSYDIFAEREVIISAGAFQSPQLLQVSGVGPADMLKKHGIDVIADRPGVGQNMNDHVMFTVSYRVNVITQHQLGYGGFEQALKDFTTEQSGLLSSPGGDFAAYEKLPAELRSNFSTKAAKDLRNFPTDWPEMQYVALPAYTGDFQNPLKNAPADGHQYASILATPIAPHSRGNVSIASPSMKDQPLINPNWLSSPTDVELAIAGFKRARQIFETGIMRDNVNIGEEYFPGIDGVSTDEEILAAIKRNFNTMFHASSTCKMGRAEDDMAVVDSKCRVYGVDRLRVVDASAFPFLPPGLPMSTVYMLAEKIADDIANGN